MRRRVSRLGNHEWSRFKAGADVACREKSSQLETIQHTAPIPQTDELYKDIRPGDEVSRSPSPLHPTGLAKSPVAAIKSSAV
jgi:hypothetical protein